MRTPVVLDGDVLDVSPLAGMAAIFSADRRRRRWLYRFLGEGPARPPKRIGMLMLNPSDAGAANDDPTITRCKAFAWTAGGSSLEVANVSDFIETDSRKMKRLPVAYYDSNSAHYVRHVLSCDVVIAAWGASTWAPAALAGLLGEPINGLMCLGATKSGQPRHPLYLSADTQLRPWARRP